MLCISIASKLYKTILRLSALSLDYVIKVYANLNQEPTVEYSGYVILKMLARKGVNMVAGPPKPTKLYHTPTVYCGKEVYVFQFPVLHGALNFNRCACEDSKYM